MEPLAQSEQVGAAFAKSVGAPTLSAPMPAGEILQAALKEKGLPFWPNVDGYFFPENPWTIYAAGRQAHVALLAGWNADEHRSAQFFKALKPTKANYLARVRADFGPNAFAVLKLFPANTPAEMEISAHDLASAQFITYSAWKWLNMQVETGDAPVYAYHFEQPFRALRFFR